LEGLREAILATITVRFDPAASEYRRVSQQLAGLTSREQLQQLLPLDLKLWSGLKSRCPMGLSFR
jgi:hypothetical protein